VPGTPDFFESPFSFFLNNRFSETVHDPLVDDVPPLFALFFVFPERVLVRSPIICQEARVRFAPFRRPADLLQVLRFPRSPLARVALFSRFFDPPAGGDSAPREPDPSRA